MARLFLEPCKSHLSQPLGSQTEHCEHSHWSCQRNNGSQRTEFFSTKKKASLCYHSIIAFICNLDLGWLLSNAFSLHYQERKEMHSIQATSQYQTVPTGACWPPPPQGLPNNLGLSSLQRTSQKTERVSKIIFFGQRNGEIQGAEGKYCSFVRKRQIPCAKHPCGLFAALMCGSGGQEGLLSLQLLHTQAAKGRDQELLCCVT